MNFQQILQLIIGGVIATIASITTLIFAEIIKKCGKFEILAIKAFSSHKVLSINITKDENKNSSISLNFSFEFVNTKKIPKILRDFNAFLYCKGKPIEKMQINCKDNSFAIAPLSINRHEIHFSISKILTIEPPFEPAFDEIRLRYFDENGKKKTYPLITIPRGWETFSDIEKKYEEWTQIN